MLLNDKVEEKDVLTAQQPLNKNERNIQPMTDSANIRINSH